jgi:hypothetical protein
MGADDVCNRVRWITRLGQQVEERSLLLVPERIPTLLVVANTRVDGDALFAGVNNAAMNLLEKVTFFSNERCEPG